MTSNARRLRCAIYTRKSSEEKQDAQLTTLENQRDYCAAYVASHGGEGWIELADHYDDGGYSGGSLKRPALTRLRADIAAGLVDVVIVYKVDRLSRSLRDFANLVAEFDQHGVSFAAVTQAFDTATSMGRLTLNVLLSFAQFERELTSERLKDWFAGARRRGHWTTGRPFGYAKAAGNSLVPHPDEAPIVKMIYHRYCKHRSGQLVADELASAGIRGGRGRPWSASMVLRVIKHRVYRGELVHRGLSLPGQHAPIISESLWQRASKIPIGGRRRSRALPAAEPIDPLILKGLVVDREGRTFSHIRMRARGRPYRYYTAGPKDRRYGKASDARMRFRAHDLETTVLDLISKATGWPWRGRSAREIDAYVRHHVDRVVVDPAEMIVHLRSGAEIRAEPGGRLAPPKGAAT